MKQIDGLVHSKTTVCFPKTVNFRLQNRQFTPFISQNSKTTIHALPSQHRNKAVAKGLKVAIFHCQENTLKFNTSSMPLDTFLQHLPVLFSRPSFAKLRYFLILHQFF